MEGDGGRRLKGGRGGGVACLRPAMLGISDALSPGRQAGLRVGTPIPDPSGVAPPMTATIIVRIYSAHLQDIC